MVVEGVNKCIKYALCIFNFAFVVLGIVLIAIGVSAQNGFSKYLHLFDTDSIGAPPKLCIAIGVIMFIIAFFGCCGAWKENHNMIMAYSVLIGLILILQLGVGIAAYLLSDDVQTLVHNGLNKTLTDYNNPNATDYQDVRKSWDFMQSELKCCGIDLYQDWGQTTPYPAGSTLIPSSCCIDGAYANCSQAITKENIHDSEMAQKYIYIEGCLPKAIEALKIKTIAIVGIGFAIAEFIGIVFACLLARNIRFSYETV